MIESFDTPSNDFGIIPSPVRLDLECDNSGEEHHIQFGCHATL